MAFTLLKAILARKMHCGQIHRIMKKVCKISITSQSNVQRHEARAILTSYAMEYSSKGRFDAILRFYIKQLHFLMPLGRISSIKFLSMIIKVLPNDILAKQSKLLVLSLAPSFVNDLQIECRKEVGKCVELLISKANMQTSETLLDMTINFLESEKSSIREMGAILCSRFVTIRKSEFNLRVGTVFPLLVTLLSKNIQQAVGRFVRVSNDFDNDERGVQNIEISSDNELVQVQKCLLKVLEVSSQIFLQKDFKVPMDELAYQSQKLLASEHEWVRINAIKTINEILKKYNSVLVGLRLQNRNVETTHQTFIYANPKNDIESLILDLSAQMVPGRTSKLIICETIKIFVIIASFLQNVPVFGIKSKQKSPTKQKVNLYWLIYVIRQLIIKEALQTPNNYDMREALLTVVEDFISGSNTKTIRLLSQPISSMVFNGVSEEDNNLNPKIRHIAIRVKKKIRERFGTDFYDKLRNSAQTNLLLRRSTRKKMANQEKINNPSRAVKRKAESRERKKTEKKLKQKI